MRDFRDAKAMAHALRDALKSKAVETSHSECLELIAKAFGCDNWNILSAKIEAAAPAKTGAEALSRWRKDTAPGKTLHCSFCGKTQHEVQALIAGPTVFICDECVGLCDDIIDEKDDREILSLLKADLESGNPAYPNAVEHLSRMTTEAVASFVKRCEKAEQRNRLAVQHIQRHLDKRRGDGLTTEGPSASARFGRLESETEESLRNRLAEAQHGLKQYADAIRIGSSVLSAREEPN